MSDEEVAFGITHNDHMGTEAWRRDAIRRIETGTILLPPELAYAHRPSRRHSGWVAVVVGVVLLGLIVLQIVLIGA